jgi:hypothetical protein
VRLPEVVTGVAGITSGRPDIPSACSTRGCANDGSGGRPHFLKRRLCARGGGMAISHGRSLRESAGWIPRPVDYRQPVGRGVGLAPDEASGWPRSRL